MKLFVTVLVIVSGVRAQEPTWTGHGRISCYSHIETDVSFGEGAENGGEGSVTCRPEEWNGVFSPEAMFFSEDQTGEECQIWYRSDDLDTGVCGAAVEKGYHGCGFAQCY